MKIHLAARFRHYRRHLEAIWKHLPLELQGQVLTGHRMDGRRLPADDIVMVGGWWDVAPFKQRIIYVEHGAGQSYRGDETAAGHPAYHGSVHPERVIGYISPNQRVADSWGRPAFAAGCPAIDDLPRVRSSPRTAAITFHWDARRVCPEAWSARGHWIDHIHEIVYMLRADKLEVIGTWHPRDNVGANIWKHLNVERVADPDEVLRRAHLLIADNTSLQFEAAKLGIPNIVLNAPWYRRDVEHGLRFWDHVPGKAFDTIEELGSFHIGGYVHNTGAIAVAQSAGDYAYSLPVGGAGEAAARWIEKLIDGQA